MIQPSSAENRRFAPATQRNRQPILEVLTRVLPQQGRILEIGSGTGEHGIYFAPALSPRLWQPSDPDPLNRASISAWNAHSPSDTLRDPLDLDTRLPIWPVETEELARSPDASLPITAIVSINMIHIAPWESCLGLLAGASRILKTGGILYLYGPFKRAGRHTADSNAQFDQMLQAQDPSWGVRDLDEVTAQAQIQGLDLQEIIPMPANNFSVIYRHR